MRKLLGGVCVLAVLAAISVPVAIGADGNEFLAKGTVTEAVSGGDWTINFAIHARGNGQSSWATVTNPGGTFSFDGSLCTGTYADPIGGTSVYIVGAQTSPATGTPTYWGFKVHQGPSGAADYSWVDIYINTLSAAQAACANPASVLSGAYFGLDASDVHFSSQF